MSDPAALYSSILDEMSSVLVGNEEIVERFTVSLLTRGHVLLEGVPGVAKTTMANLFARATGMESNRIQMTPDLLPADVTGTQVYREATGEFELQQGPVFSNLVIADEINRATPKTQSALLEAMQEGHTTLGGQTMPLPTPFMVIATQNPLEMEGTFELPEAQRDRFQFKLTVPLPDRATERELFDRFDADPLVDERDVEQVADLEAIMDAREAVTAVHVAEALREYVLDVVAASRDHADVEHGGSPRATLAFLNAGKARAAIQGREYVIPDDVKALARPILVHRLVLTTDADLSDVTSEDVVDDILAEVPTPGSEELTPEAAGGEEAIGDGGAPGGSGR